MDNIITYDDDEENPDQLKLNFNIEIEGLQNLSPSSVSPIPIEERWDPLGAAANDDDDLNIDIDCKFDPRSLFDSGTVNTLLNNAVVTLENTMNFSPDGQIMDTHRIKSLEEEQEILTSSLMALTSHFAQVQFRLRQIVEAPQNERDILLKNLEEFAFRGIPEISDQNPSSEEDDILSPKLVESAREHQYELIDRLKRQLADLEKFAYDSGASVLPQSLVLEKQKIIIDELKNKLNLNVSDSDLPQLSSEDIRNQVDTAIGEIVGPFKMKEQLVAQLKTQITDLERFIAFLQCDSDETRLKAIEMGFPTNELDDVMNKKIELSAYNSYAAKKKAAEKTRSRNQSLSENAISSGNNNVNELKSSTKNTKKNESDKSTSACKDFKVKQEFDNSEKCESLNQKAHNLLDKASTILQMFALSQFGCSSNQTGNYFHQNTLKKTQWGNHWGDIRAQLELDIQEVINLVRALNNDQERLNSLKAKAIEEKLLNHNSISSTSNNSDQSVPLNTDIEHKYKQNYPLPITSQYTGSSSSSKTKCLTTNQTTSQYLRQKPCTAPYSLSMTNVELTTIVRRNFAVTLQKLLQHGLRTYYNTTANLIVPFMGCFNAGNNPSNNAYDTNSDYKHSNGSSSYLNDDENIHNSTENLNSDDNDDEPSNKYNLKNIDENDSYYGGGRSNSRQMHAWELILEYYNIKNGESYNDTPARKLSKSFNLEISGGQAISNKQSLLSCIGNIIAMHLPYKRSYNSHFKAFVCSGLNTHKLVHWLNLIFQCTEIIQQYYEPWSYVARTGGKDALRSIDSLTQYDFDLPVDLAIRQFENIKDVFM